MAKPTYEEDLAMFLRLTEYGERASWLRAEHALRMTERHGRRTASMLAADTGYSASYIRQLVATARAFPNEEDRAADLSFTHHRYAAMTENPAEWIDKAVQNGWTQRELQNAIADAKDPLSEAERARRAEEQLEQKARKYNEHWSVMTGKRAVLMWVDAQSQVTA